MMKNNKSALWMRGAGLMLAGMMCGALPAGATVKTGEHQVSINAGAAIPTTKYDLSASGGSSEVMGGSGVGFGGQYLYHLTPALGLGSEFSYAAFGDKDHAIGPVLGVPGTIVTSSYKTWTMEAIARYVLMPESRVNPYFIAGVGLGSVSAKASTRLPPGLVFASTGSREATNFDGSATGVAFSLGAGADADITDSLFAGLDLRWRFVGAKKDFADQAVPGTVHSISSGSGLAVAGKIGYKFGR